MSHVASEEIIKFNIYSGLKLWKAKYRNKVSQLYEEYTY